MDLWFLDFFMPKIVDHEKRREEILNACFTSFAQRGYAAVTMRDLARVSGVSTGSLYHYFSTKEDIFQQMFVQLNQQDTMRATEQLVTLPVAERTEALMQFVRENEEYFQNVLMMALEYVRHDEHQESSEFVHELVHNYQIALEGMLEIPLPGMGSVLFSLLMGLVAHRKLSPEAVNWELHLRFLQTMMESFQRSSAA